MGPDMICAGDLVTPSMGPCNGDSGGGLMDGNQIVGITSWEARGCGHPEHPGVFLQVSYFLDWIASHTVLRHRTFDLKPDHRPLSTDPMTRVIEIHFGILK